MKNMHISKTYINIIYNSGILQQYFTFAYSTYPTMMYTYLLHGAESFLRSYKVFS